MVRMSYIGHMNRHVIDLLDFDQADRMRKAREVAGYSQSELARRLSIARQSVSNYEQRHTKPLPAIRKAWAGACGVDENWLITGERGEEWLPRRDSNLEPADYRTTDDGINVWGWVA